MEDIQLTHLVIAFVLLMLLAAFFSAAETSMMALNRYKVRHLAKEGHVSARLVESLIERPDKLLGLILLGSNLANFGVASVATVIAVQLMGDVGVAVMPLIMAPLSLILAELAPKTVSALYAERVAFPSAFVLAPLGQILNPIVWASTQFSNAILDLFGIDPERREDDPISREELRTVVLETTGMIPRRHQHMLLSILDLEEITVDDIMVPRSEIVGIDLNKSPVEIAETLYNSQHTRLPAYRGSIDNIVGILHARRLPRILKDRGEVSAGQIESVLQEPYFVPLGTHLHNQLVNFQRTRQRSALVVDEYGVIQGLATIEDILEEIVGKFTTDLQTHHQYIHPQPDGTCLIDAGVTIREINRQLHWDLPAEGPRTLNGLILEHLQTMPESGTSLRIGNYAMEVTGVTENAVRTVRVTRLPDSPAAGG